jgi:hypothetical protein
MRKVTQVQVANALHNNSDGKNPKLVPTLSSNSSAIKALRLFDKIVS